MRILHTSDWHLGRTFHGRVLDNAHAAFTDHLVELVAAESVGAVLVAGDVYDRAIPPNDAVALLDETLRRLTERTRVVLTPGNHDSARRLGFAADLMREGLIIRARTAGLDRGIILPDADGNDAAIVHALPYLDPDAAREILPPLLAERLGEETPAKHTAGEDQAENRDASSQPDPPERPRLPRSHEAVVSAALRLVAADLDRLHTGRSRRLPSLLMAHAFVVGGEACESERDIRVGGVDSVPAGVYTGLGGSPLAERSGGLDYAALGHLHRPQEIRQRSAAVGPAGPHPDDDAVITGPRLVYSGSPLPFSFPEADFPKSTVLLDIGADGVTRLERVPAPLPYRAVTLTGTLEKVLALTPDHREDWVRVRLNGAAPPDAMARLKVELPNLLAFSRTPPPRAEGERAPVTRASDPLEVADRFLARMLGRSARPDERAVIARAYDAARAANEGSPSCDCTR